MHSHVAAGSALSSAGNGLPSAAATPPAHRLNGVAGGSDGSRPPLDYFGRGDALSRAASEGGVLPHPEGLTPQSVRLLPARVHACPALVCQA